MTKELAEQLGFTKEEVEEIEKNTEEYPPSLEIPFGPSDRVVVRIPTLEMKEVVQEKGGKKETTQTLTVEDESGVKFTLWLSGVSIRRELYRVVALRKKQNKKPEGMVVAIWKEEYDHAVHGKTIGYKMQILNDSQLDEAQ